MNLTRTKTIEQSIADTEEPEHQLRKELGPVQLTVFGVGVIIGTGIFVLTGENPGAAARAAPITGRGNRPRPTHLRRGRGVRGRPRTLPHLASQDRRP